MDTQTLLKVARLARLHIAPDQVPVMAAKLDGIFKWIEQLNAVNTDGVEPMTSVVDQGAFRRADVVTDGNRQAEIIANAPDSAEGFFVVPKVVE